MGKSRVEIQRACRERLKQKNKEEYLRRERERKNRSYVPQSYLKMIVIEEIGKIKNV